MGGSLTNRLRFTREMVRVCREALGPDRALSMKIAGDELVEGGLRLPDMQEIVRILDADRMIDFYVIASGNDMEKFARVDHWPPTPAPQALHAPLAAGIKRVTSRPVAALARIVSPAVAERLVAEGVCDLVAMVRATIAEPDLVLKIATGRARDVRPCVGDSIGLHRPDHRRRAACAASTTRSSAASANGALSKRREVSRRVLGNRRRAGRPGGGPCRGAAWPPGGPFERQASWAARVRVTARQPGREEMIRIAHWLGEQAQAAGVDVRLNTDRDGGSVPAPSSRMWWILAAGRETRRSKRSGRLARSPVVSAWAILSGHPESAGNVLVLDHTGPAGRLRGGGAAADAGGRAEVVSRQFHPAVDFGLTNTVSLYRRLFRKGVELTAHHDLRHIRDGVVTLFNYYNQRERRIDGRRSGRRRHLAGAGRRDAAAAPRRGPRRASDRRLRRASRHRVRDFRRSPCRAPRLTRTTATCPMTLAAARATMVQVVDVHKQYGDHEVLRGVSVDVTMGEKIVIIGPSGAGKSTMLRCINYLERPQQGHVYLDGTLVGESSRTVTTFR